jgi:hypothetical protein
VGNIVTGSLQAQTSVPVDGIAYSIQVSWQNYTAGQYGYDGDGLQDIRIKLPKWIRTQNRAVSADDYKTLTDQFSTPYHGSIGKSLAVLRNYGCAANIIDLYVLASAGSGALETASPELKVDLNTYLNTIQMMTDYVCIKDGEIVSVEVNVEATLDQSYSKFATDITQSIQNVVTSFFDLNLWEYGQSLQDVDLVKQLASGVPQVNTFTVSFTYSTYVAVSIVTVNFYQIIRPDTTNISLNYE